MDLESIGRHLQDLSTPILFDACLRLGEPPRLAPPGLRPLARGMRAFGPVRPARHAGSVDVFLEAMERARSGDVLVIDNGGRLDEGCIGDLTVLEARGAGLAALVVWGAHRDTPELLRIGFPVFSYGAHPAGPTRLDPRDGEALESALFGPHLVSGGDLVFADDDGAIFLPGSALGRLLEAAHGIQRTERRQATEIGAGRTLRSQIRFADYLERRRGDPSLTFRAHLRSIGGAIEE